MTGRWICSGVVQRGDSPVLQWILTNDYKDVPEWVESIPYSETRDCVQSILRNREMHKAIYGEVQWGRAR